MTKPSTLSRRQALKGAVLLLGGAAAARLDTVSAQVLAAAERPETFIPADLFRMLERIVDVVIPETATPGAKAAGVHVFIDVMLGEWASAATRNRYLAELRAMAGRARREIGEPFESAGETRQLAFLRRLDAEAFGEDAAAPFFAELKALIVFGYYTSEAGASEELRFDPIPGDYRPCTPMKDDDHAWSIVSI